MQEDKCERCGKRSVRMTIMTYDKGVQETICTDCFNEEMSERYGVEDFKDFVRNYTAVDCNGVSHEFEINKRIMGTGVFWEAIEVNNGKDSGYEFNVHAEMDDEQHEAVQRLYDKIYKGLSNNYIYAKTYYGQKVYSIVKDEIVGRIEWHSEGDETVLIIDGKQYSLEEFGEILRCREGFNFKMQIFDPTDDID